MTLTIQDALADQRKDGEMVGACLSYCSTAVMKCHDQGNLIEGLLYSFRRLVYDHQGTEHGDRQVDMVLRAVSESSHLSCKLQRVRLGLA